MFGVEEAKVMFFSLQQKELNVSLHQEKKFVTMLEEILKQLFIKSFKTLYGQEPNAQQVNFQKTRPEFEGDLTVVVFPFGKLAGRNPEQLANEMGAEMMKESSMIAKFNVVKGFLNILISDQYWLDFFRENHEMENFGRRPVEGKKVVIEYSSPNTNKPLHLGHIRNNLLGWSVSEILKANGKNVVRVNLVNDRGIHICMKPQCSAMVSFDHSGCFFSWRLASSMRRYNGSCFASV